MHFKNPDTQQYSVCGGLTEYHIIPIYAFPLFSFGAAVLSGGMVQKNQFTISIIV